MLRFWLERGVDGFRIDALRQVIKDDALARQPARTPAGARATTPTARCCPSSRPIGPRSPRSCAVLRRAVEDARSADGRERVLIGELYLPVERLMAYYGYGVDLPANFHLLLDAVARRRSIGALVDAYEAALPDGAWPNWVLEQPRPAAARQPRLGAAQARAAAVLLLTLRGTPTLYYGDEIGMADVPVPPDRVQDPWERRVPGQGLGRDPERTPMQWDDGPERRLLRARGAIRGCRSPTTPRRDQRRRPARRPATRC